MDKLCNYFRINNVCFLTVLAFILHILFLSRRFVYKVRINFGKSCSALGSGCTKLCNSDYQNRAWTSKLQIILLMREISEWCVILLEHFGFVVSLTPSFLIPVIYFYFRILMMKMREKEKVFKKRIPRKMMNAVKVFEKVFLFFVKEEGTKENALIL